MGDGFVKLYGQKLVDSTLWLEEPATRLVFLSMLAIADSEGVVDLPGVAVLANRLNLPLDYVQGALDVLLAPDPESRSKELDGRRLVKLDGPGWRCVNYAKYREYRGAKKEAARVRQAKWRERQRVEDGVTNNARDAPEDRGQKREEREHARADVTTGQLLAAEYERRYSERLASFPSKSAAYQKSLKTVVEWCDGQCGLEGAAPTAVVTKLLDGFFATANPKVAGDWSLRFLATDPLEFYSPRDANEHVPGGTEDVKRRMAEEVTVDR